MTKEALTLCLRVLRPIAEDRVYETRWLQDAIDAAELALMSQAQPLSDDDIEKLYTPIWGEIINPRDKEETIKFARAIEKAHGIGE